MEGMSFLQQWNELVNMPEPVTSDIGLEITTRHLCRQAWRSTCAEENCILISSLVFGETDWQRPQVPLDVQVENMEDALEESMALHDGEVIDPVDEPRSGDLGR